MKELTKLFIVFSVIIVLLQVFSLSYLVLVTTAAAQEEEEKPDITGAVIRVPFWDLPSELKTFSFEPCPEECQVTDPADVCQAKQSKTCLNIPWIAMYIGAAYRYAVVLGSILAVFMIMLGGVLYLVGGFNQSMIKTGKDLITGAIVGLILLLGSYVVLNTINPNFVKLKPVKIERQKEQALVSKMNCSQAGQLGFVVDEPNWQTTNTCGTEFKVKYVGAAANKSGAGQYCISDSCGKTNLSCTKNLDKPGYSCKSVLVYGTITNLDVLTLAQCSIAQTVFGTAFDFGKYYIDELRLQYVDNDGDLQNLTDDIDVGVSKDSYYIEKKQLTANNIPDSAPILLSVDVNDGYWGMTFTYEIAGKTKNFQGANDIAPIVFCPVGNTQKMFMVQGEKGKYLYTAIPSLTWGELKNSPVGMHWNINVPKELFDCKEGETIKKPEMSCQYAFSSGSKQGESCNSNTDCLAGLLCDDDEDICVPAPLPCFSDAGCIFGGSCEGGYCDCDTDFGCAAGYRCADNTSSDYNNNDPCVLENL